MTETNRALGPNTANLSPSQGESSSGVGRTGGLSGITPIGSTEGFTTTVNHRVGAEAGVNAHMAILEMLNSDRATRRMPEGCDVTVYREEVRPVVEGAIVRIVGEFQRMKREVNGAEVVLIEGAEYYPEALREIRVLDRTLSTLPRGSRTIYDIVADAAHEVKGTRKRLEEIPHIVEGFPSEFAKTPQQIEDGQNEKVKAKPDAVKRHGPNGRERLSPTSPDYVLPTGETFYGQHAILLAEIVGHESDGYLTSKTLIARVWPDLPMHVAYSRLKSVIKQVRCGLEGTRYSIDSKQGINGGYAWRENTSQT